MIQPSPAINTINARFVDYAQNNEFHPLHSLKALIEDWWCGNKLSFKFQSYTFEAGRYDLDARRLRTREDFTIHAMDLDSSALGDFFDAATARGEDVVLCSNVAIEAKWDYHLPMVDFALKSPARIEVNSEAMFYPGNFHFYHSGRSYHAYGKEVIPNHAWPSFMGDLLFLNDPENDVVDVRWIGHSLIRGYSALRWTCVNPKYQQIPGRMIDNDGSPFVEPLPF